VPTWNAVPAIVRSTAVVVAHLAAVAVVGLADLVTGPRYELRIFYLIPVMTAAWIGGRTLGLLIAAVSSLSLFYANNYVAGATAPGIELPVWNAAGAFILYSVVVVLTAQLRERNEELRAKRDDLLREAELREGSITLLVHELRHSAASMALASASLESSPRLADDERSFVGRLRQQASDLEHVASGLLTISRLESGSLALDLAPVDLCALAADAVSASMAPERIEVKCGARRVAVHADPEHVRRALDNYIRNALAFSAAPSRVTVEVVERDGLGGLLVTDHGAGFDPSETSKLFHKYARLDATRDRHDGAGLGLYLTRLIIEAHGGHVDASSEGNGKGARFGLYLPLAREGV
jgi:signal transduction histidine kinase